MLAFKPSTTRPGGTVMVLLLAGLALAVASVACFRLTRTPARPIQSAFPVPVARAVVPMDDERHPRPVEFSMGVIQGTSQRFILSEGRLQHHMAVLGNIGSGKSRFLNLLLRYHIAAAWAAHGKLKSRDAATGAMWAAILIDPHGDLAEDLLAYAARKVADTGDKTLIESIHYLEPDYRSAFGYDPYRFTAPEGLTSEEQKTAYITWLHAKVDRIVEILQRKQGQPNTEGMPRLQRVLRDVLTAVGMAIDDSGKHLPLGDALVLLDIYHRRHHDVFQRVAPFLDSAILADFERWHRMKSPDQFLREAESSINRLRSFFSPIIKAIFAETVRTVNLYSIIQRGEVVLVNLRETPFFSRDQKMALGGMLIHDVLEVVQQTPRELRKRCTLVIDESGEFLAEDLPAALGACRKHLLSLVLAGQDLSTFRKGADLDITPKLLSLCGTKVCYQQAWPPDLDILAQSLGYGSLDFTEKEVERHDGYEWHDVVEWSEGTSRQENWTESDGETWSHAKSTQLSEVHGWQQQWNSGSSSQQSQGDTTSADGALSSRNSGSAASLSHGQSGGASGSESVSSGTSSSLGGSRSTSRGGSSGTSRSTSHKKVPLAKIVREITGEMRTPISDQFEKMKAGIFCLPDRHAVVKCRDKTQAFVIKTHDVPDPFVSADAQFMAVEWIKKELAALRPYTVKPSLDHAEEDKRLDDYLAQPAPANGTAIEQPPSTNGNGHVSHESQPFAQTKKGPFDE